MPNLVSRATGNLTNVATWKTVEAGTRAIQSLHSALTLTTTSDVYNADAQDFTIVNLSVIEGVLLFCQQVTATGTITITLSADSGATATKTLVVNATDLPLFPSWVFFKFATTLTGDGGTDYAIGVKGSSAGNANFFRDATAANWTHLIVTNQNPGAVAAGDVFYIVGEQTGAGTENAFVVTMDSVAATDYGTGTDGADVNGVETGNNGTLAYGFAAATNYYLKLSGSYNIWGDATLTIGTVANPIPRGSTAVLEFDPVLDGGMGLLVRDGGTLIVQGLSRTVGKNFVVCKLNTDEAVASTSLGVDTDTGWLDNDEIVVGSTSRTASNTEKGALNGAAGASALTVDGFAGAGGGLAFAHTGTSPAQGEVALLTRNVRIRGAVSTVMAYVHATAVSTVDIDWAEFYYLGENAALKTGIEVATTTGTFNMQFSSLHDCEDWGFRLTSTSGTGIVASDNIFYNLNASIASSTYGIQTAATSGSYVFTNNVCMRLFAGGSGSGDGARFNDLQGSTISGNIFVGCDSVSFTESNGVATISNNVFHSGGAIFASGATLALTFSGCSFWRNVSGTVTQGYQYPWLLTYTSCTFFGNANYNMLLGQGTTIVIRSSTFNSDAAFTTPVGIQVNNSGGFIYLFDTTFGVTLGHTTADIVYGASDAVISVRTYAFNCTFASATEFLMSGMSDFGAIFSHKHDGSTTTFKNQYRVGIVQSDTAIRHTASGYAFKMTPTFTARKLKTPGPSEFDGWKAAVNAAALVTITAWVYKDSSYNGNAPRLVLVGGIVGGIAADVVDSLTVAHSTWEQLEVTATPNEAGVVEYYVDCDGSAGTVRVQDVEVVQA